MSLENIIDEGLRDMAAHEGETRFSKALRMLLENMCVEVHEVIQVI